MKITSKLQGNRLYDLIIIGGGPAGLSAGIYAQRARLKTVLLEKGILGGQVALTDLIENYPGYIEIVGPELVHKFEAQARKLGLEIKNIEAIKVKECQDGVKTVSTGEGDYSAKAVIIATGASPETLGAKGELEFIGRGVSYCATCDGFFFQDKEIAVVGGGDSAMTEALFLSKLACKIYLIHRRDALRAEKILQERALANPKIEFIWNTVVEEISGDSKVEKILVKNVKTREKKEIKVEGVFIYVGLRPNTELVDVDKDSKGFIIAGENMETSIKGIFAAGDCRAKTLRQILAAASEGAAAAMEAERYIRGDRKWRSSK